MDLKVFEEKMNKTISVLVENLSEVRAGRANPAILNKVMVNYYGVPTPINQVAGISVPEARLIVIQPWDASILKEIEKEILKAEIGINPNNDGKVIRLAFPELNEERRKELVKDIRKIAEESRVAVRSIRRDGMDSAKTALKNSEITINDRHSTGSNISKSKIKDVFISPELQTKKDIEEETKEIKKIGKNCGIGALLYLVIAYGISIITTLLSMVFSFLLIFDIPYISSYAFNGMKNIENN